MRTENLVIGSRIFPVNSRRSALRRARVPESHAPLVGQKKEPDLAGSLTMGAAAWLFRELTRCVHHAYGFAIFFAEQRHRPRLQRDVDRKLPRSSPGVFSTTRRFTSVSMSGERAIRSARAKWLKSKAQPAREPPATPACLTWSPDDLAERRVEQMRRGVVALDRRATRRIDLGGHVVPRGETPGLDGDAARRSSRRPAGQVSSTRTRAAGRDDPPGVADLARRPRRRTASPRARCSPRSPLRASCADHSAVRIEGDDGLTPSSVAARNPSKVVWWWPGELDATHPLASSFLPPFHDAWARARCLAELDVEPGACRGVTPRSSATSCARSRRQPERVVRGGNSSDPVRTVRTRRELADRLVEKRQTGGDGLAEALFLAARDLEDGGLRSDDFRVDLAQRLDDGRGDVASRNGPVKAELPAVPDRAARGPGAARSRACRSRGRRRRRRGSTARACDPR